MQLVLASGRRLLFYLIAWVPITALIGYVVWASGMPAGAAAQVLTPSCFLYAFICLSPYSICRALPLGRVNPARLALIFVMAASLASAALVASARLVSYLFERPVPPLSLLFGMGVLLYLLSVGLHYAALAAESSHIAERRAVEARELAREAELHSLRIQLNPHFLFNSLHSISALATLDGARAREMCLRLADFLRSSLSLGALETIPLRDEIALARSYLAVEQVRFGDRLRIETEIDAACEDCAIPALLLQPLVENAVKHGIAGLVDGGAIRLVAERSLGEVVITIRNAFDPESPAPRGTRLGQEHVRRRLQVRYGDDARFQAAAEDQVYRVVLRLPCESSIASINRA